MLFFLFLLSVPLSFNQTSMQARNKDRQPVVAGTFYPANPVELSKTINGLLANAKPASNKGFVRALVVPHAGYVFSGSVAASGFNQIDPNYPYQNIFILASSHRVSLGKASVYTSGDYITPLGRVEVNKEISKKLATSNDFFTDDPEAHMEEHSIEVQLPFLQTVIKNPFKIVPIVLASQVTSVSEAVAEELKPYFTPENLFILSADFSHYPPYEQAIQVDQATAEAFCSNSIDDFLAVLKSNEQKRIPGLVTSMCAWPSGLTLLHLTTHNRALEFVRIDYQNSGDSKLYGDKSGVVGYQAITIVEKQEKGFILTQDDREELLRIARNTLESYIRRRETPSLTPKQYSPNLKTKAGAFVTLKVGEKLRGCIGSFEADRPLYQLVQQLAIASSTQDNRFLPVQPKELSDIHIEISVLTPMRKIKDINEIVLGKHGIYIKEGFQSGTFLPQVARETGWNLEEFLGHCARDKAGIGWDGWKQAEIYVYEALEFQEKRLP